VAFLRIFLALVKSFRLRLVAIRHWAAATLQRGRLHFRSRVQFTLLLPAVRVYSIGMLYLCLLIIAESVTTLLDPQKGMILHAVVLVVLLVHGSVVHKGPLRRLLVVLALAPLVRILSLSIPLAKLGLPLIYWYLIIGAPLFLAAWVASRVTDLGGSRIGWSWGRVPVQILLGSTGLLLGYAEYLILRPGPLANYLGPIDVMTASFILLVFTGVLEEVIFRGLMQSAAMQVLGRFGLVYIAILFAVLHLGYHSVVDLLFVLAVGLFFGWMVWRTGSLLGASLAHGIANISLYVFFPFIFAAGAGPIASPEYSAPPAAVIDSTPTSPPIPAVGESATPFVEIIVDNGTPGFLQAGATTFLDNARGFGGSFRWVYTTQSGPDVVVTWVPALNACGIYNVEAYLPNAAGATASAEYLVNHNLGQTQVRVDQAAHRGEWVALGAYEFSPGTAASLQLANLSGDEPKLMRWVGFDAVRWIFRGPCGTAIPAP
jgi:uncharacterized protein